jgi:hypothetical protein
MTPAVPGKAYFIAENQRHNALSSFSVNSYPPGFGDRDALTGNAFDRTLSGNGTTFVVSHSSPTVPPLVDPAAPQTFAFPLAHRPPRKVDWACEGPAEE